VDGDEGAAVFLHDAGDQLVVLVLFPSQADLPGDRNMQSGGQFPKSAGNFQRSRHHPHTRAAVGDAFCRAAHVDVDDVRV
jgi:hypothetical protein